MVFKDSRYTNTPLHLQNDKIPILEIRKRNKFNLNNATLYTVIQGDTLDGISYKVYGKAEFYWAILDANPKYQNVLDIKNGDVIVIPSFDEVVNLIE